MATAEPIPQDHEPEKRAPVRRGPIVFGWAMLLALTAVLVAALETAGLPAGELMGAMAAAILVAVFRAPVRVPRFAFFVSQGLIGCLIAQSVPPSMAGEIARDWPLLLAPVLAVVVASNLLGWAVARSGVLPGTTAVWGSSPGAAAAMTLMSGDYGADIRLVAFMQYARVVLVVVTASLVSRLWVEPGAAAHPTVWFPPVSWPALGTTLAVVAAGVTIARALRIPAGALLVPMALAILAQNVGGAPLQLPHWLLATAYALVGWSIGARFTREILRHAARALPQIVASIVVLIAVCGGFAWALVRFGGVDPLTAYLATSPGGADSVAIIAASSASVDTPFVMALQTARLLFVLATGPAVARFIAGRVAKANAGQ